MAKVGHYIPNHLLTLKRDYQISPMSYKNYTASPAACARNNITYRNYSNVVQKQQLNKRPSSKTYRKSSTSSFVESSSSESSSSAADWEVGSVETFVDFDDSRIESDSIYDSRSCTEQSQRRTLTKKTSDESSNRTMTISSKAPKETEQHHTKKIEDNNREIDRILNTPNLHAKLFTSGETTMWNKIPANGVPRRRSLSQKVHEQQADDQESHEKHHKTQYRADKENREVEFVHHKPAAQAGSLEVLKDTNTINNINNTTKSHRLTKPSPATANDQLIRVAREKVFAFTRKLENLSALTLENSIFLENLNNCLCGIESEASLSKRSSYQEANISAKDKLLTELANITNHGKPQKLFQPSEETLSQASHTSNCKSPNRRAHQHLREGKNDRSGSQSGSRETVNLKEATSSSLIVCMEDRDPTDHRCPFLLPTPRLAAKMNRFAKELSQFGYGLLLLKVDDAINLEMDQSSELEGSSSGFSEKREDSELYFDV